MIGTQATMTFFWDTERKNTWPLRYCYNCCKVDPADGCPNLPFYVALQLRLTL